MKLGMGHWDDETQRPERRPLWRPAPKRSWPPYALVEEGIAERAQARLERLERLYHVGQEQAWDGRAVLEDLVARHGPPRLPAGGKVPVLRILSVLLWGELAAWAISADLAEQIEDVEAKMAATSQAHDEARHFYVLRDYVRATGERIPRLGGLGRRLLVGILETPSLVHKLIGMQLLVESNALAMFRALVEADVEPVLGALLPYYEKDEARHVGLGVLYLPRLLRGLSAVEAVGAAGFQLRCLAYLMSAGLLLRDDFRALGIDPRALASHTVKLQDDIVREMFVGLRAAQGAEAARARLRGVLNPRHSVGPRILDFVHPPGGDDAAPPWHRAALRLWREGAAVVDRALA